MAIKHYLETIDLTHPKYLQTLVENRRVFNLENCELNIFESYKETYRVPLVFGDFLISSMVRGKKVMHLPNRAAFDYLPGETVIAPAFEPMEIDFPEAEMSNPTQCIALAVSGAYIKETLDYLNLVYSAASDESPSWHLQFSQFHFTNDTEITHLINKLMRICSGGDIAKNIYADLNLKELLIRLLQTQQLLQISVDSSANTNQNRMHYVLNYIREHLTEKIAIDTLSRKAYLSRNVFFKWFREQFGITPLEYINRERIKMAKQLLTDPRNNLADVSLQCGFNDVNYFVRLFRKTEGITPGMYREAMQFEVGEIRV
ncbi:MAG: AraC family transcriptional regulator [Chitinophagaceae bacterium]